MKMRIHGIAFLIGMLFHLYASAQDFSNKGKEFWLAYSYHVGMVNSGFPVMTLYITSDVNTSFSVEIFGTAVLQTGDIIAGQVMSVIIPNTYFIDNEGKFINRAIRVMADKPVVVYSYITRSAASAATLCLPTNVLGREYYSINFTQVSNEVNSNSYFTIVAVEDNTTVEITPAANTKNGWVANTVYTINLNKGEIYQVLAQTTGNTGEDLTGSKIKSVSSGAGGCKKIAVFSGSGKILINASGVCPPSLNSSDNLYQQLYPLNTWGKKYLTVPSYNRITNLYRIIKSTPTANVYLNGTLIPAGSFTNNLYYQFYNTVPNLIESDEPISVSQYFTTQQCDGNPAPYDPDMILLNPVEQNIDKVTLVSSNLFAGNPQHHLHVIMRNGGTSVSSFSLDGLPVPPSSWKPHPGDPNFSYLYLNNVSQGYHRLASDSGFNAIAYGYADAETYGYSAGANVKDLYQFISIRNQFASVNFPSTCVNTPFIFSMTFPYKPTGIKWIFDGLFPDVTLTDPIHDSTWFVNGKQLFRYKLAGSYNIPDTGTYPIRVIAQNPTIDGCSGEQEIVYDLQVFDKPLADFKFNSTGCISDTVKFLDNSNTNGRPGNKWFWNFDDGSISGVKNPLHLFMSSGDFNVKYSLITDIGCISDTVSKTITINALPTANFNISSPYCVGRDILFTDISVPNSGNIIKWFWDFGDGTITTKTKGDPFTHKYAVPGSYTVTLKVETDKGCNSTILSKPVVVTPLPEAKFTMPDNCVSDPSSLFSDFTTIPDGSQAQFTYEWNFGDPNATNANPNTSNQKNPQHRYTVPGNYNILLTVTSNAGCVDTTSQVFTLNGMQPQSIFSINGGNQACSNKTVSIINNSTIDVGKLVKLEIFWDYNNDPTNKSIIQYPQNGELYDHKYPEFFTPLTRSYTIRVIAYSGDNCLHSSSQVITMNATPEIVFSPLQDICANASTLNITNANLGNSLPGTGIYSGNGISSSGQFDPLIAGVGLHNIRYTFTGENGCTDFKEQTIRILPVPTVSAGADRFVLEGGFVLLQGKATGNNISYLWTPSNWLNNPGIAQPQSKPEDDITYTLTVSSADGCSASDQVFIKYLKAPVVPNTFSPNGDGVHDRWEISSLESYPGATVEIYNRYGQLVFQSTGYKKPWDGTSQGKPLPAGTYYYIINPKNGRKQMSGFIDIIR